MYTLYIGYGWGDKTVNGDYMCGIYPLAGAALVAVRSSDRISAFISDVRQVVIFYVSH